MSSELEEIASAVVEDNYYGNADVRHILWKTIVRLPVEIARWVMSQGFFFYGSGDQLGEYLPFDEPIDHLFFLSGKLIGKDEAEACFTIAHEIAHARLHREGRFLAGGEECEKACDELASEWGFRHRDS